MYCTLPSIPRGTKAVRKEECHITVPSQQSKPPVPHTYACGWGWCGDPGSIQLMLQGRASFVPTPSLTLPCCVTTDESLHLSGAHFLLWKVCLMSPLRFCGRVGRQIPMVTNSVRCEPWCAREHLRPHNVLHGWIYISLTPCNKHIVFFTFFAVVANVY